MDITQTFTAETCETKYYNTTAYYSYTVTQQGYRNGDLMVGFVVIPSLKNVDWTKYKIKSITATFKKTYGGSGHTAWFWRSAYQSIGAYKGSAFIVTDAGHAEVDAHANEEGSVSTTLSASAVEWFSAYLQEKNPQVFCVYHDSTSNNLYFNGFSLTITYAEASSSVYVQTASGLQPGEVYVQTASGLIAGSVNVMTANGMKESS